VTVIRAAGTGAYATIGRVVISPAAAHLVLATAGLHDGLALPAAASHHFRHESFDFAGLAAAAAASWFGIPGPGEPVLIAAGVLAAQRHLALLPVLIVAWAAATAGGIAGWVLGRKAGRALLTWPGPLRATRLRAVIRGEELFARHAVIAILLTPAWIAGINRARPAVYLSLNAASAAVWACGIGLGAYFAGPAVIDVVDDVGTVTSGILAVVIVAAVVFEIRRRHLRQA
jgi:membrane protein DedA with SNARE-associated domain